MNEQDSNAIWKGGKDEQAADVANMEYLRRPKGDMPLSPEIGLILEQDAEGETPSVCTAKKIPVDSINQLAQAYASELRSPSLKSHLKRLITSLEGLGQVDGVALVVRAKQHLSVDVLARVDRSDPESKACLRDVGRFYDSFSASIRHARADLTCSLSFYDTRHTSSNALLEDLQAKWQHDPTVSLIGFSTK